MHKKGHTLKTSPLVKNPQFSSNLADIQAKLATHEVVILTTFHKNCKIFFDFLLLPFWLLPLIQTNFCPKTWIHLLNCTPRFKWLPPAL